MPTPEKAPKPSKLREISSRLAKSKSPKTPGSSVRPSASGVAASKGKTRTAYVVSHTHWDREWRYPIWETRLMLLDFMDELVEVLETGKYPSFLLDGQVSPVLDYLDVRPEMAERVKALVASGKLLIGPWYTLPDEYPVDGEALVRNLLWGHRKSAEFGRTFKVGYTPFGWGQTAQLPQLYAGFGMDVAMIGKRVSKDRAPHCEFLWRAPDGTELLTTRFGDWGRQNFYFIIHLSTLHGVDYIGSDWAYDPATGGIAYHRAEPNQMEQDHFRLDPPSKCSLEFVNETTMERAWDSMHESFLTDDRLMMNGCDYTASQPLFPEVMERLNELDRDTDRQWIHTSMEEYVEAMRHKIDRKKLPLVEGELRDGPAMATTGNAMTTRLDNKILNKKAQNLLIRHAEPLAMAAAFVGVPYPEALLRKAWDFLLQSHPHDSINGVTQDKTARDVAFRLDQAVDIAESLGNRAMQELVRRMDLSELDPQKAVLVVFNPLPYPRREVLEAYVNLPDPGHSNTEWPPIFASLEVLDAKGNPVGTQWMGATNELYSVAELHARAVPYNCQRHRLFFDTGDIPAGGYKTFVVDHADESKPKKAPWSDWQSRTSTLLTAPGVAENECLRVKMNPNGTFDLEDKRTGRVFAGLNYYEDRGELGDYWNNCRPMYDQIHTSIGCAARVWAEEAGPLQATLHSEIAMRLPKRANIDRYRREEDTADLVIRTAVTLRAGAEHVEVNVAFDNQHQHHYLRAMFPTGIEKATHSDAGGHFHVDRRPIAPAGPVKGTLWPDMATLPMNNFVDVADGKTGLAFLTDSLTEFEVTDNRERTVALSLLRAVRNWVCTEHRVGSDFPSQKGGQALGTHTVRYAIRPHAGDWKAANLPLAAELFNIPTPVVQTNAHPGTLPAASASFLEIDNPNIRFSTIKRAEDRDSLVVRVYNPTDRKQSGSLRLAAKPVRAWVANLDEQRESELEIAKSGAVPLVLPRGKILTVEVETEKR